MVSGREDVSLGPTRPLSQDLGSYRITGSARNEAELTAALAFCEEHGARLEMD
jgi:hypothetical protein